LLLDVEEGGELKEDKVDSFTFAIISSSYYYYYWMLKKEEN